jgi:hypothetical protein
MVTRTFNFVERKVKVYDPDTKTMIEVTYSASKNDKKWRKDIENEGFIILEVVSEKEYETKIGMEEDDFFRIGTVLNK